MLSVLSRRVLAAVAAMSCLVIAMPAGADVSPPVNVRLVSEFVPATAGQPYRGQILVEGAGGAEISLPAIAGRGNWTVLSQTPVAARADDGPGTLRLDFEAIPFSPDQPLQIDILVDDNPVTLSLDLSREAWLRATRPGRLVPAGDAVSPGVWQPTPWQQESPGPPVRGWVRDGSEPEAESGLAAGAARGLQVRGLVGCRRDYDYGEGPRGDSAWIGAHGAKVYLFELTPGNDRVLVSGYADAQGSVDLTYWWDPAAEGEEDPDLGLMVALDSPGTKVVDPTTETPYSFQIYLVADFPGTELNFGALEAGTQDMRGRTCAFNYMQRAYEHFLQFGGGGEDTPSLMVRIPNGGPNGGSGGVNYPDAWWVWYEDVAYHERAHNWMAHLGRYPSLGSYCNQWNYCDKDPANSHCNHCVWCNEDEYIAYSEGFADWVGSEGPLHIPQLWGTPLLSGFSVEVNGLCRDSSGAACQCDPLMTEGIFAAALQDIGDDVQENDPKFSAVYGDAMSLGADAVFDVFRGWPTPEPDSEQVLRAIGDANPSMKPALWQTLMNNGIDFDTGAPGAALNLTSTSHPLGVNVPIGTVQLRWDPPVDDWSGAAGYSIAFATSSVMPDTVAEFTGGGAGYWASDLLAPGTWYASVRAVDRVGHWSAQAATYGPILISAYTPVDLVFRDYSTWDHTVVPRGSNDATNLVVTAPTLLRGDGHLTWGNLRGANMSSFDPCYGFESAFEIDGKRVWTGATAPLAPGQIFRHINQGPFFVGGGRHTFVGEIDFDDSVVESDEENNRWGRQWIWKPGSTISIDRDQQYSAPPSRSGGWDAVDGTLYFNVRGLRFTPDAVWTAFVIWPENEYADYDLRLHVASTGAEDGFAANRGWSSRAEGCTDAVLINRNVEPTSATTPWDVGIINYNESTGNVHARRIEGQAFTFGNTDSLLLLTDEMMHLHTFFVGTSALGSIDVSVTSEDDSAPLYVNVFPRTLGTGDLHDSIAYGVLETGESTVTLNFETSSIGSYAVGIYRDAMDGNVDRGYTLRIGPAQSNLQPWADAGWTAPIVPRDQLDLTWPWPTVGNPGALYGDIQPTYAYVKMRNAGFAASDPHQVWLELDGVPVQAYDRNGVPAGGTDQFTTGGGFVVPGGRHTLSVVVDALAAVVEAVEDDNREGRQWMWRPVVQEVGPRIVRAEPPDPMGGWEDIPDGENRGWNLDAIRPPDWGVVGSEGVRRAVVLLPTQSADYDLILGNRSNSTTRGFTSWSAQGGWGAGMGDFVILQAWESVEPLHEVGIRKYSGSGPYEIQVVEAVDLGHEPWGLSGLHVMAADELLHLYSVDLDPGDHSVAIVPEGGEIDWGISSYSGSISHRFKSGTVQPSAISWLAGVNEAEGFDYQIAEAGRYVIAVWKSGYGDVGKTGQYRLRFDSTATDAPAAHLDRRTRIVSVNPNPFNPRTTVLFELDSPARAVITVFNVRGERIRSIVDERLQPGRYLRSWNGTDDRGATVASGTYLVQLQAGQVTDQRKVLLLK